MCFKYLNNKSWSEITREERYINYELVSDIRNDKKSFLKLLGINTEEDFDVEPEVCFYRDLLKDYQLKNIFHKKRTFDIVLFFTNDIYIIETKAQQKLTKKEINRYLKDQNKVKLLFKIIKEKTNKINFVEPEIHVCFIISDKNYKKLSQDKENENYKIFTWKKIAEKYNNKIYSRAEEIYNN